MNIECGIYFQSPNPETTTPSAKIGVQDKTSPYLMICTPSKGNIEITTGTGQVNVGGDLLLRGHNVSIGVPDGSDGQVLINNSEALTDFRFKKDFLPEITQSINELQASIKDLQKQINSLKSPQE